MKINRRALIASIVGIAVSVPIIKKLFFARVTNQNLAANFSALIDTFVPADKFPGALDLEIDVRLRDKIRTNQEYWDKIVQYLNRIDNLSKQVYKIRFEDASLEQRTKLLSTLLSDDSRQELQLQLKTLKNQTFTYFYTAQPAFDMLAYHPPSRGGYLDYDQSL